MVFYLATHIRISHVNPATQIGMALVRLQKLWASARSTATEIARSDLQTLNEADLPHASRVHASPVLCGRYAAAAACGFPPFAMTGVRFATCCRSVRFRNSVATAMPQRHQPASYPWCWVLYSRLMTALARTGLSRRSARTAALSREPGRLRLAGDVSRHARGRLPSRGRPG